MDEGGFFGGLFLGFVVGGFLSFWFTLTMASEHWQDQVQQRGYSEYCQTDGSWSWKGECND